MAENDDEEGVESWDVELDPGEEWHSNAIKIHKGETVTLTCTSDGRFYAGIFSREEYVRRKGAAAGSFDFLFGSDRHAFTKRFRARGDDTYYIVLRVGIFSDGQTIDVRFEVE